MKMLRNNILVKELSKEQLGKIVLPQNVKDDDWLRGRVICIGPEVDDLVVGDIIIYPPMPPGMGGMLTISVDGVAHILLNNKVALAVED